MDMQGSRQLGVTQQQAWAALNDPEVLKVCIPGCESIESAGDHAYAISSMVKVGPVAARFKSTIELTDIREPESYTLNFNGNGGAAGFGQGSARVTLTPGAQGCELGYVVNAKVGGKIAQVGQRLIDGVAKSMAESFFRHFDEEMQRRHPAADAALEAAARETAAPLAGARHRPPLWVWALVVVLALLGLFWASR
jgi:carbon monoxide dehydrogenase subunit G